MGATEKRSRVVVVLDISPEHDPRHATRCKRRPARPRRGWTCSSTSSPTTRTTARSASSRRSWRRTPSSIYPFGTRLDDSPQMIEREEKPWAATEWEAFANYDFRPFILKGLSEDGQADGAQLDLPVKWDGPRSRRAEETGACELGRLGRDVGRPCAGASSRPTRGDRCRQAPAARRRSLRGGRRNPPGEREEARTPHRRGADRSPSAPTSPTRVTAAVNREAPNMVQGIVVFSDGRSNLGSDSSYRELRDRATPREDRSSPSPSARTGRPRASPSPRCRPTTTPRPTRGSRSSSRPTA